MDHAGKFPPLAWRLYQNDLYAMMNPRYNAGIPNWTSPILSIASINNIARHNALRKLELFDFPHSWLEGVGDFRSPKIASPADLRVFRSLERFSSCISDAALLSILPHMINIWELYIITDPVCHQILAVITFLKPKTLTKLKLRCGRGQCHLCL